jgi:ribosomal protein L37E
MPRGVYKRRTNKVFAYACEHVDRIHYARGLCSACYSKARRGLQPDWLEKHRDNIYFYTVGRKFGITKEVVQDLMLQQKGVCAICGQTEPSGKRLAVDHCHVNGTVRGLLCQNCNLGLGYFQDNTERMEKAIMYLKPFTKPSRTSI